MNDIVRERGSGERIETRKKECEGYTRERKIYREKTKEKERRGQISKCMFTINLGENVGSRR